MRDSELHSYPLELCFLHYFVNKIRARNGGTCHEEYGRKIKQSNLHWATLKKDLNTNICIVQ